jgi:hypothetical protein
LTALTGRTQPPQGRILAMKNVIRLFFILTVALITASLLRSMF